MTKTKGAHIIFKEWAKFNAGKDIKSFEDFVKIYTFFRKAQASFGVRKKHYYMTSSSAESGSTNTQRKNLADVQPSWPHAGPITNIFSTRQGKNLSWKLGLRARIWKSVGFEVVFQLFLVEILGEEGDLAPVRERNWAGWKPGLRARV